MNNCAIQILVLTLLLLIESLSQNSSYENCIIVSKLSQKWDNLTKTNMQTNIASNLLVNKIILKEALIHIRWFLLKIKFFLKLSECVGENHAGRIICDYCEFCCEINIDNHRINLAICTTSFD